MNRSELVATRDVRKDDLPFIFATWLKSLRYGNSWFKAIDQESYFNVYHTVIENILSSPASSVKVACLADDPDVILGYAVYDALIPTTHWVFVKRAWRGIGIAKLLVPADTTAVTHLTDVGKTIANKKGWKFNPFIGG